MRPFQKAIAFAPLLLCSCGDPPAVKECQDWLLSKLVAPSTFKRVKFDETPSKDVYYVEIDFDAQNRFGAMIRNKALCLFAAEGMKAGTFKSEESFIDDKQSIKEY